MDVLTLVKCFLGDSIIFIVYFLKTVFDWIILDYNLATPITLISIAFFITKRINDKQLAINDKNNQEKILDDYLESVGNILLNRNSYYDDDKTVNIIRSKTLSILKRLILKPEDDKSIILRFLYDTKLISYDRTPSGTFLNVASFDFQKVNLKRADLQRIKLVKANFQGANLQEANLQGADLQGANLQGANLQGANLRGANLYQVNLNTIQLKLANNWTEAVYISDKQYSIEKAMYFPLSKEANDAVIEKMKAQN